MNHRTAGLQPTFLVIGAYKAGTTSIHRYLKQHPQIFMSRIKETRFLTYAGHEQSPLSSVEFVSLPWRIKSLPAYEMLFAEALHTQARGDVSPCYLEFAKQSILGIQTHVPQARLIAILRQPADRAYSHHLYNYVEGKEEEIDFRQALQYERENRMRQLDGAPRRNLARGFYFGALQQYFQSFPREQMRIWLYDDLQADTHGLLQEIFRFIDVDDAFLTDISTRYNPTRWPRLPFAPPLYRRVVKVFTRTIRHLPRSLHRHGITGLQRLAWRRPPSFDPALRSELTAFFREDILRTQDLIGRDLSHWLV